MKIWQSMMGKSQNQLFSMLENPAGIQEFENSLGFLDKYLTFVPFIRGGASIEDVEEIIRRKSDDRMAREGKSFDMVVIDYPALLTSRVASEGKWAKRHVDEAVYKDVTQLAGELKFHALVSIQTNREGSKINRGLSKKEEKRLLSMEDVQESWGPMTSATNVISINRSIKAMNANRLTYLLCKSRSSETGQAVVCRTNYTHATTHSDGLGAAWYRGGSAMEGRVDSYLKTHGGGGVPGQDNLIGQ